MCELYVSLNLYLICESATSFENSSNEAVVLTDEMESVLLKESDYYCNEDVSEESKISSSFK